MNMTHSGECNESFRKLVNLPEGHFLVQLRRQFNEYLVRASRKVTVKGSEFSWPKPRTSSPDSLPSDGGYSAFKKELKLLKLAPERGERCGELDAAANGQIPSGSGGTNCFGRLLLELSHAFKGAGGVPVVGWMFACLASVAERADKASEQSKIREELINKWNVSIDFFVKFLDKEKNSGRPGPSDLAKKTLQDFMCMAGLFERTSSNRKIYIPIKRFLCAFANEAEFAELRNWLGHQRDELNAGLLTLSRENFELTGKVLVGAERVDQAFRKFESNDSVRAVVLWGMPGSGKTVLAQRMASKIVQAGNKGHRCMFIMKSDTPIRENQEKLYCQMHLSGETKEFSDDRHGRQGLRSLFESHPYVLIIDGVNDPAEVEELLPETFSLAPGSVMLVTTTNARVINVLKEKGVACQAYEVNVVENTEAQELLLKTIVGEQGGMLAIYLGKSEPFLKLLDLCGGLLVAIIEVGKHVRMRGKQIVDELLSRVSPGQAYSNVSLGTAYSKLDSDIQAEFLRKLVEVINHVHKELSVGRPISTSEKNHLHRALDSVHKLNAGLRRVFLQLVDGSQVGGNWGDAELAYGQENLAELRHLSMVKPSSSTDGTSGVHEPVVQVHGLLRARGRRLAREELG